MNETPWLTPYYEKIAQRYRALKLHHALLFQSIAGNGLDRLINHVINLLLCTRPENGKACQTCHACQLFQAKTHPDFYVIAAEKKSIGVDDIRRVLAKLYESSQLGGNKVVWINNAENLTEAASNGLLKTLEEPPKHTYFILDCEIIAKINATIKSRCIHDFIAPPSLKTAYEWLEMRTPAYNKTERITALRLTQHAPLAAENLLRDDIWTQRAQFYTDLFTHLTEKNCFLLYEKIKNAVISDQIFSWLAILFCDAIKYQLNTTAFIINRDQAKLIHALSTEFDAQQLVWLYQKTQENSEKLKTQTVNKELILATFFSQLDQLLYNNHTLCM